MTLLTTHVLDAINGRSAAGVRIQLNRLEADGGATLLHDLVCDHEGRLSIALDASEANCRLEMVVFAAVYFAIEDAAVPEVVVRFRPTGARQHIPVILSPQSCSIWWSKPE